MTTFADIILEARSLLQDEGTIRRYSDSELMRGANEAMRIIRKSRPDLFIGSFTAVISDYADSDTLPIGNEYINAVKSYIIAYAEMRESEDAGLAKSAMFIKKFSDEVMSL